MQNLPRMLVVAIACLAATVDGAEPPQVFPDRVRFDDAFDRRQLIVTLPHEGGFQDATRSAGYRATDPGIVRVDAQGRLQPVAPGETSVEVELGNQKVVVPVMVAALDQARRVHFGREVEPLLSRYGCNAGGCHGKASGQNGFKLSLFGFDTAFDFAALTAEARGRRIATSNPEGSLLLLKAIGKAPHGGGRRFEPGSEAYEVIRRWIAQGAAEDAPDSPQVVSLKVFPTDRVLGRDARQQLAALVEYSDGSVRDVTQEAQFSSNNEVVASVAADGLVQTQTASGEAAVMARYMGQVAVFRALVPHAPAAHAAGEAPVTVPVHNEIDRLVAAKWKKLGLEPSPLADDPTFLRRVTIDLCGRIPTPAEVREFLSDTSTDKRTRAVDRLLASPDYPAFFAMRWGAILRNSNLAGSTQAAYAFHNWMKDQIARNRPYDEFVRGIVAASGEWQDAPAINWYWQSRDDQLHQVTADTAQVFLGIRLQCARCHHHPYERWGQHDYYGLAGFFTRLGRKSFGEPPPYFNAGLVTTGERNPLTDKVPEPKFPDGPVGEFAPDQDPRHALVDWMARPDNPFFAKILVNRLWGHFLGRGLVDQIDDMRETNPPSNPELLDYLAQNFIRNKFDTRATIREIVLSSTYQLSSEPTVHNQSDHQNYARFLARRMMAEVIHDALDQATGSPTHFSNMASDARAIDLPHEGFGSYFLDTFDRPRRVTGCECERSTAATLGQVLLISNSDEVENKLADGKGRVAQLVQAKKTDLEIIEELYLATLSRPPTSSETARTTAYVQQQPPESRQQAFEDLLWTLLNTKEFLFNR